MGQQWPKNGKKLGFGVIFHFFAIFGPFFPHFGPRAFFFFFGQFFPIFGFRPVFHYAAWLVSPVLIPLPLLKGDTSIQAHSSIPKSEAFTGPSNMEVGLMLATTGALPRASVRYSQVHAWHIQQITLWHEIQAVLDGVPPTGLQLLRWERVLLMLWIKGLEHLKSEVMLSPPRVRPLKNSMRKYYENNSLRIIFRNFWGILCSWNVQERKEVIQGITCEIRNLPRLNISE